MYSLMDTFSENKYNRLLLNRNFSKTVVASAVFVVVFFGFTGCERSAPSPVEIKIDDSLPGIHVVLNNETIYDIAYAYNIDPQNLAEINNLQAPYKLKNGQKLRLPNYKDTDGNSYSENGSILYSSSATKSEGANRAGYVALDDEKSYYNYENKNENRKKEEIDEDFDAMVLADERAQKSNANKNKTSDSVSAAKNTESLSSPKVTATAVGGPVTKSTDKNKEEAEKKNFAEKSSNESSKNTKKTQNNSANNSYVNSGSGATSSKKMIMPVKGKIVSHYGDIVDGISNDGINIKAPKGTDVVAAADGTVIYVGNKLDEEYGNVVIIQHSDGLITSYAHLDKATVRKDSSVNAGEKIGTVGKTGDVNEPQLYFEVMKNKKPVNPSIYLKK